jgi:hypothetical protein
MFLIAHAGHWLANVLYAAPLLIVVAVFIVSKLKERGTPDGGGDTLGVEAGAGRSTAPAPAPKPAPAPPRKGKRNKRR